MRRVRLVKNRDFMLLWTGEAVSQLGSQASTVAFPLLVLSLTGSAAKAGIVGLAKWLPLALTALPAGMAADRFDRKRADDRLRRHSCAPAGDDSRRPLARPPILLSNRSSGVFWTVACSRSVTWLSGERCRT